MSPLGYVYGSVTGLVIHQAGLSGLNDWVDRQLAGAGVGLFACVLLFLGGLLASLLPCVYPLYPITASIIRSRSTGGGSWAHPVAYYLGLLVVYAGFGVVAAVSGGAFNVVLRWAATNLVIAGVFALLALSTAGWLHLSIFQPRDVSVRPGLLGTVVLGGAAGLLSSACVGPVVVGVLLRLATGLEGGIDLGRVGTGALQMGAFGAGVGLPLLCIAVFGVTLPRSGGWMVWVQLLLAAVIGYFAYGYLEKGLAILGYPGETAGVLTAAILLLTWMAYAIQPDEVFAELRMRRAVLACGIVLAAAVLFRTVQPTAGIAASSGSVGEMAKVNGPAFERDGELTWHLDADAAYAEAKRLGKPVFIDFYGAWCTNCKAFQKLTETDPALRGGLKQAVLLKVYDTAPDFGKYQADSRFPELKVGLPFFVITDAAGSLLYKTNDYLKTDEMLLFLGE